MTISDNNWLKKNGNITTPKLPDGIRTELPKGVKREFPAGVWRELPPEITREPLAGVPGVRPFLITGEV